MVTVCSGCYQCTAFFTGEKYIWGSAAKLFYFSISRIAIKGLGYGYNSNNSNILIKSITCEEQTVTIVPVVPILPAKSMAYNFKKLLAVSYLFYFSN